MRVKVNRGAVILVIGSAVLGMAETWRRGWDLIGLWEGSRPWLIVAVAALVHELGHIAAARWVGAGIRGMKLDLFGARLELGGLLSYGYLSGENMLALDEGRPMFLRMPEAKFDLANFMRANLYGALGALKVGMNILMIDEKVEIDRIQGHGGFFKTKGVGQKLMADAINVPVSVLETAGEGGAWGIAILAAFMSRKDGDESLSDYLNQKVFGSQNSAVINPDPEGVKGFETYMERFMKGLAVERAAVQYLDC